MIIRSVLILFTLLIQSNFSTASITRLCRSIIQVQACDSFSECGASEPMYRSVCSMEDGNTYIYDESGELVKVLRDTHIPCSREGIEGCDSKSGLNLSTDPIADSDIGSGIFSGPSSEEIASYHDFRDLTGMNDPKLPPGLGAMPFKNFERIKTYSFNVRSRTIDTFKVNLGIMLKAQKIKIQSSPNHGYEPLRPHPYFESDLGLKGVLSMISQKAGEVSEEDVLNFGWPEFGIYADEVSQNLRKQFAKHVEALNENLLVRKNYLDSSDNLLMGEEEVVSPRISYPIVDIPSEFQFREEHRNTSEKIFDYQAPDEEKAQIKGILNYFLDESMESWSKQEYLKAVRQLKLAQEGLDFLVGWDPISGFVRSAWELVEGKNLITGEELGSWEYAFALIGIATMGTSSTAIKGVQTTQKILRKLDKFVGLKPLARGISEKSLVGLRHIEKWNPITNSSEKAVQELTGVLKRYEKMLPGSVELTKLYDKSKLKYYNPMNPGPLSELNKGGYRISDTFRSGTYFEVTSSQPTKVYRVWGGEVKKRGGYWTRVKPQGATQVAMDSALDPNWGNLTNEIAVMNIPEGVTFYEGVVSNIKIRKGLGAPATGVLPGGGNQIYIDPNLIKKEWLSNE